MWKDTVRALQTGALAELAVVAFVVAFVLVVAYAFTLKKAQREAMKQMPLDDWPEASRTADVLDPDAPDHA